jgi:hypothetical protein
MDGNEGSLGGIGDLAGVLATQRAGGTFATQAAMLAFASKGRKTGMLVCVLEDCAQYIYDAAGTDGIAPDDGIGRWRPVRNFQMLYGRSMSFLAAGLLDLDGFVTTLSTITSADVLTGAELNGALVVANVGLPPKPGIAFWPSVTSSSTTGAFVAGSDIVFTGTYNGQVVTRTSTLTAANGNETIIADGPLETLTRIDIEAQADTDGSFTFGFSGIGPVLLAGGTSYKKWLVKSYADASAADTAALHVAYADGTTDTVELAKGAQLEAAPVRIYGDSTGNYTVYE